MSDSAAPPIAGVRFLLVAAVWLGMLIGVSFLATPVKFTAPSLTLPVALDVGRVTFALFNKAEWVMFVLLALFAGLARARGLRLWSAAGLGIILAAQTFWLLPPLDMRTAAIIAGEAVADSPYHRIYIGAEAIKFGLLAAILWTCAAARGSRE